MSMIKPYSKTFPAGATSVVIGRNEVGFPLDAAAGCYQLVTDGVGAGTWGVDALFPDEVWRNVQAATLVQASVWTLDEKFVVRGLRVIYANLAGATPSATFSAQGRIIRAGFGT